MGAHAHSWKTIDDDQFGFVIAGLLISMLARLIAIVSMITCNNESYFMIAPLKFNTNPIVLTKTERAGRSEQKWKRGADKQHEHTSNLIGCNDAV